MDPISSASARLDPLPLGHAPDLAGEFDALVRTLGFVPNSILTMQRQPELVRGFAHLQRALWGSDSTVDRGFKRLVAHIASCVACDPYSMAHTASGALHFGIDAEKLVVLRDYRTSPLFSAAERAALDLAVAASSDPNAVNDGLFVALRMHWNERQIVEIVGVIAMAGFLSRWNLTFATPIEDEPNAVGEQYLAPNGWNAGQHRR
jgi:alkylhydroperoxidase family enzyme